MKNLILNLEGVSVLSRNEQKSISAGKAALVGPDTCTATCADGTKAGASSCDTSQANLACSQNGGSSSCECGGKGPLDPPGFN